MYGYWEQKGGIVLRERSGLRVAWRSGLSDPCVWWCDGVRGLFRQRLISSQLEQVLWAFLACWQWRQIPDAFLSPFPLPLSLCLFGPEQLMPWSAVILIMLSNACWESTNYPDVPFHVCMLLSSTSAAVPAVHDSTRQGRQRQWQRRWLSHKARRRAQSWLSQGTLWVWKKTN